MPERTVNIWYGTGENSVLSNLAHRPFVYGSYRYITVEHAYQTLKSGVFDETTYRQNWKAGVKFRGKQVKASISLFLMRQLVFASFEQNVKALRALNLTGDAPITHIPDRTIWREEFPRILTQLRTLTQLLEKG